MWKQVDGRSRFFGVPATLEEAIAWCDDDCENCVWTEKTVDGYLETSVSPCEDHKEAIAAGEKLLTTALEETDLLERTTELVNKKRSATTDLQNANT